MENKEINNDKTNVATAMGYNKQDIELALRLLNNIPVTSFIETQAKYQIYEILMKPSYEFEPPTDKE